MKSTLINLVLVFLLLLSFSTGCGGKKSVTPTKAPANEGIPDFKGGDIMFYEPTMSGSNVAGESLDKYYAGMPKWDVKYIRERIKEIEEKYNCQLVIQKIKRDEFETAVNSGEYVADIGLFGNREILKSIALKDKGFLQPLDKYASILELDNMNSWDVRETNYLRYGGENTYVLCQKSMNDGAGIHALIFNKGLLEEAGLWDKYNLYELQKNMQWTWDVFQELCIEIPKDTDADGKSDLSALHFYYPPEQIREFVIANGQKNSSFPVYIDENNKDAVLDIQKEQFAPALDLFKRLISANAITLDDYYNGFESTKNKFYDGKALFTIKNITEAFSGGRGQYNFEVGIVSIPMGPNANRYTATIDTSLKGGGIMKNASNPSDLVYVLKDYCSPLISEDAADFFRSEVLMDQWDLTEEQLESFDFICENTEPIYQDFTVLYMATAPLHEAIIKCIEDEGSVDWVYEEVIPEMEQNLNDNWRPYKEGLLYLEDK